MSPSKNCQQHIALSHHHTNHLSLSLDTIPPHSIPAEITHFMGFPPEAVPFGISIQDTKVGSSGVKVSNLGTLGAFGRRGVLMPRSRAFNAAALLRPVFGTPLPSKVPSKSEIAVMSKVEEERPIGTTVPSTPEICRPFLGARLRSGAWL